MAYNAVYQQEPLVPQDTLVSALVGDPNCVLVGALVEELDGSLDGF